MAGSIGDEGNKLFVRRLFRAAFVEEPANQPGDVQVRPFVAAADIVRLARLAAANHRVDAPAVVLDVEPVADVAAVAVDRNRLLQQAGADHGGDEFLAVLPGTVVVGAVGGDHRQAVGMEIGSHQMIGAGLGGGVGRVGGVGRGFSKRRIVVLERAVNLIGRDVMEAAAIRRLPVQPSGAGGFQQREGADQIGLHEGRRPGDGAVHMAFGGEVGDGVDGVLAQQPVHQRPVANVAPHEQVPGRIGQVAQVVQRAGVSQQIESDDAEVGVVGQ